MKAARIYAQRLGWASRAAARRHERRCSCRKGARRVPSAGKHPRVLEWETEATAELATIEAWIERWPRGNVGIATGAIVGVLRVRRRPRSRRQRDARRARRRARPLPVTPEQITGSGGRHYLFKLPGFTVTNSAGGLARASTRAARAARSSSRRRVSAEGRLSLGQGRAPGTCEIAEAPAWLLERLSRAAATRPARPSVTPRIARLLPAGDT
jgi:hypothetical protein